MNRVSLADIAAPGGLVGGPFGSSLVSSDYVDNGVPVIRGANMSAGRYVGGEFAFVSESKLQRDLARNTASPDDIIFTQRGTLGQVALVPQTPFATYVVSQSQMRLRVDATKADPRFVFYAATASDFLKQIDDHAISTGVPHTNLGILSKLTIPLPPPAVQQAIAEVLGALDDKIAANTALSGALDRHMMLTVVKNAAAGVEFALRDIAAFHNRRRVPLSATERGSRHGTVPYYGASGVFGSVDEALFDEPIVLVGEDGSVINGDSSPVTQYVWGPAWVNNHAHVLTGQRVSTELLFHLVRGSDVSTLVTGAVQPKISMGNLERLELRIPAGSNLRRTEELVARETASKRSVLEENRTLAATRDALLPQLMSGKLRVRDAEAAASAAGA